MGYGNDPDDKVSHLSEILSQRGIQNVLMSLSMKQQFSENPLFTRASVILVSFQFYLPHYQYGTYMAFISKKCFRYYRDLYKYLVVLLVYG